MRVLSLFAVCITAYGLSIQKKSTAALMDPEVSMEDKAAARAKVYEGLRKRAMEKHARSMDRIHSRGHQQDSTIHMEVAQLDLGAMARDDVERELKGMAPRYAQRTHVTEGPALSGTWTQLDPETLEWKFIANSFGATSMNLGFEHFNLPEGAVMTVSSADEAFKFHVTAEDNKEHNQFWTPPIPGGHVKVVVTMHADHRPHIEDSIILSRVNIGYRGFHSADHLAEEGVDSSGKCHYDAHCENAVLGWDNEIPCVAVYSTGGELFCSGALLNNFRQDGTPYFLTAHHCEITDANAASVVTVWNYEDKKGGKLDCPGNAHDESFNFNWMTGSKHLVSYKPTDMTFLKLDKSPPESWGASYCGWSVKDQETQLSVTIHHPNTFHKRKSASNKPSRISNTWLRVDGYQYGATEVGSSGAPMFNEKKLVVGQLNGGLAECVGNMPNGKYDQYGRLAISFNKGMRQYLDPDHNGAEELKTLSGISGTGAPVDLNKDGKISKVDIKEAYGCGKDSRRMCNGKEACFENKNVGDGFCDGNTAEYGINACCYNLDGGDCTAAQCVGTTGPIPMKSL